MVRKLIALILIAAGLTALVYKGFSYTRETHEAELGPLKFQMKERERVEIPTWLGVALVAIGAGILVVPAGRRRS